MGTQISDEFIATAGNVKTPRPGIWDMLGRAKWYLYLHIQTLWRHSNIINRDAWAKHKDLESFEAKWLYVESLLKVRSLIILLSSYVLTYDRSFANIPTKQLP